MGRDRLSPAPRPAPRRPRPARTSPPPTTDCNRPGSPRRTLAARRCPGPGRSPPSRRSMGTAPPHPCPRCRRPAGRHRRAGNAARSCAAPRTGTEVRTVRSAAGPSAIHDRSYPAGRAYGPSPSRAPRRGSGYDTVARGWIRRDKSACRARNNAETDTGCGGLPSGERRTPRRASDLPGQGNDLPKRARRRAEGRGLPPPARCVGPTQQSPDRHGIVGFLPRKKHTEQLLLDRPHFVSICSTVIRAGPGRPHGESTGPIRRTGMGRRPMTAGCSSRSRVAVP